ncbi:MAG: TetR/AcrR family transcriptional regulator [Solirubrobacteraceae bacterium]
MSSLVGTRRAHAPEMRTSSKANGRLLSGTRPSRTVPRRPSSPAEPHGLPTEIQRKRLLSAAIRSLDEVGYAHTSVAHITSRARVSRRTFYELFATREECLLAVFDDVVALIDRELAAAELEDLPWRERVRLGMWTILSFFEREPARARVCVVQSLQGDAKLLERREALLEGLVAIVDEGREQSAKAAQATPLTAEGLVGAALSILYTRLMRERREPLTDLLGELMGLIVLPYLGSAAAKREQARPAPAPVAGQSERVSQGEHLATDPFEGISMRLTYRTLRVLECVAAEPGASNRQLGVLADVPDQGQISKLLGRLERLGLLVNTRDAGAKGEANVWQLTAQGLQVTQTIGLDTQGRQ